MAWTNPVDYSVGQATCVAKIDEQVLANIDFAGSHSHSGAAGDGSKNFVSGSTVLGNNQTQVVERHIVRPLLLPSCTLISEAANFNASYITFYTSSYRSPSSATGAASAEYLVDLDIGVWEVSFIYRKQAIGDIVSACLSGACIGQFDPTQAVTVFNNKTSSSFITISASGTKRLQLASKGAGSGGAANTHVHMVELIRRSA